MPTQYDAVDRSMTESHCWSPFWKQLHVSSTIWTLFFINGLSTGAPTVLIPQIRKEWNSTVTVDDELASWMYSASNFAGMPWLLLLPSISQLIGRKIPCLACSIAMTTVFVILYFSSSPYHILIAEAIQGFTNAAAVTIIIHVIPEYCNHRYRSMYINIQCTTFYWGMWVSNAIGTFLNWKYITILGLICSLYSFTIAFYPESPRWLASKGKFTECKTAHRWIRGCSTDAEKELRDLMKSQTNNSENSYKMTCSNLLKTLTCKQFYMPLLLLNLVGAQNNFSGKLVCSIYSLEIFKKITKNEDMAYTGMLILDGVTVLGMYTGSLLSKFLKLRSLYFSLSFLSIGVMFTFSLYLYLSKLAIIEENDIVALGFLVVYSLAISSGPIILSFNFYSEIISIKYQAISYAITSFFFLGSSTGMLKFAPVLFRELGLHGSFLFYGLACGTFTSLLYAYLPETKNKTLEEIEQCFKDTKRLPETEILTKEIEDGIRQ